MNHLAILLIKGNRNLFFKYLRYDQVPVSNYEVKNHDQAFENTNFTLYDHLIFIRESEKSQTFWNIQI